jgi:pimeloyl-ACP methyl ester carboxylesterase
MPTLDVNGCAINYIVEGTGDPVMLIHGFASSLHGNWRAPGVVDAIVAAGRQVIAIDCRGHGRSGKPHDPSAYGGTAMADDAVAVLDHLNIEKADLAGYSMGGFLASTLLVNRPQRWRSVIISGMGDVLLQGNLPSARFDSLAAAMEAPDAASIKDPRGRAFRAFAESSGNDLGALAAMHKTRRAGFDPAKLADVKIPVLILIGNKDDPASARRLADAIPGASFVEVPGDHLGAVATPEFRNAIVAWLTNR